MHDFNLYFIPVLSAPARHSWIPREIERFSWTFKVTNHFSEGSADELLCLEVMFGCRPSFPIQENLSWKEVGELVVGVISVVEANWTRNQKTGLVDHAKISRLVDHAHCRARTDIARLHKILVDHVHSWNKREKRIIAPRKSVQSFATLHVTSLNNRQMYID